MNKLAIHFLNDEQPVTQEAVNELIFNIRNNQITNAWLALDEYGEEDFLSAELELVPAGRAREAGLDRSLILAYGQEKCSK